MNKTKQKRTKLIRLLLSIGALISSIYAGYALRQKEDIISTALETPEGRQALAEAMVETAKDQEE